MEKQAFGVVGLGVMGANLAHNMERNGFSIAAFDRSADKTNEFIQKSQGKKIKGARSLADLASMLEKPRRILLMVPAGGPVDAVLAEIKGNLEDGDIVIDGGNSLYGDTERRAKQLDGEGNGIRFFGMGVSGGEEGALWGPSMMPGGDKESYNRLKPVLDKIAAKAPSDKVPCVTYCGSGGAGHFVKMVHNGIEYGDMQLIAEAYDLLKNVGGMNNSQMKDVFTEWNAGELQSFLIEVTMKVIDFKDPKGSGALVENIRDIVGMKGTGTWTIKAALDLLVSVPTMAAAVDARELSMLKTEREAASKVLTGPTPKKFEGDIKAFVNDVKDALYCSKICSYAQGMALLAAANRPIPKDKNAPMGFGYGMNLPELPMIWRAGCIIRAVFLEEITKAFTENPSLPNLLMDSRFTKMINDRQAAWRRVVTAGIANGICTPAFSASLAYYDSYRRARLPGNLIQAQRDYFGAHTFERNDAPGTFIHNDWSAK